MGQSIQGRPGAATLGRSRTIVFPRFTESLPIASPNHSAKDRSGAIHLANGMTSGDSNQVAPCPRPRVVKTCDSYFPVCPLPGKHGKIDPVGTDEIDPVKTA